MDTNRFYKTLPRISYFESFPQGRKVRLRLTLYLIGVYFALEFQQTIEKVNSQGIPITRQDVTKLRLKRMFVGGAAGGLLASTFTNPRTWRVAFHLTHCRLFAFWSNFLISADAAMDSKNLDAESSQQLLTRGLIAIHVGHAVPASGDLSSKFLQEYEAHFGEPLVVPEQGLYYPLEAGFRFENYSIYLAIELGKTLRKLAAYHSVFATFEHYSLHQNEFHQRLLQLVLGQMASLEQAIIDENHDWGWYINVLNEKSLNVLLAPLAVFTELNNTMDKSGLLQRYFLLVNQLFFHRQVLDDLLDCRTDTEEGLGSTLVYLVVGQGHLAEYLLEDISYLLSEGEIPNAESENRRLEVATKVLSECSRSGLLEHHTWSWRECSANLKQRANNIVDVDPRTVSVEDLSTLITYALANKPTDIFISLQELAKICILRKTGLLQAWQVRNKEQVIDIVIESSVVLRILNSVADSRNKDEIERELMMFGDEGPRDVFWLFYHRTMRTYQRVLKEWAP